MTKLLIKNLAIVIFISCLLSCDGYVPPLELIPPDPNLCFAQGVIEKTGGTLKIEMAECGSLRWSKVEFDPDSISIDTEFRLSVGDELINEPSFKLNYPLTLEKITPDDSSITGNVFFNVPYVAPLLEEHGYTALDVLAFFKNTGDSASALARVYSLKDDEDKRIKTVIRDVGTYQPGVHIHTAMDLADMKNLDFAIGQTSFLVEIGGGENFVMMLTEIPLGIYSQPVTASPNLSYYTVESSEEAISAPMRIQRNKNLSSSDDFTKIGKDQADGIMRDKLNERVELSLINPSLGKKLPRSPKKHTTLLEGETITGLNIWDFSDCQPYTTGCEELLRNQEAIVHATNETAIFLVHNYENYYNDTMTDDQKLAVDELASKFDEMIHPRNAFFFGDPPDVDGNEKIMVILTDRLLETNILGFFYGIDLFENDGIPYLLGGYDDSNEADIIYTVVPNDDVNELLLQSIIAHEYQHVINFNNKTLSKLVDEPGVPLDANLITSLTPFEEVFLDEGFSHFAEDIGGLADVEAGIAHILNHPEDSYTPYLKNNGSSSLIDTRGLVSYAVRGHNYLLIRYLFEQAGGATPVEGEAGYVDGGGIAFLKELISSNLTGIAAIDHVFPTFDKNGERNFYELYLDWLVALYNDKLDESLLDTTKYNFDDTYNDEITDQIVGIDLSATRNLVTGGDYSEIVLNGPMVEVFENGDTSYFSHIATAGAGYVSYRTPLTPSKSILRLAIVGEAIGMQGLILRTQ